MDKEQQLVFLKSQILCAEIEMQSMISTNQLRDVNGDSPAYDEQAFMDLIDKYGISHDYITEILRIH